MTVLRHNVMWASEHVHGHDLEQPLLAPMKRLREALTSGGPADLEGFSALDLVTPFLIIVRSHEASGPFTLASLTALKNIVTRRVLHGKMQHVREAANEIIDAVANCRFEQTNAHLDEVVMMELMDLLVRCITGDLASYLGDEAIWEALHTCFVNCNLLVHTPMLCNSAERALERIISGLFRGVSASGVVHVDAQSERTPRSCHGLPCLVKVFGFLCSQLLCTPASANHTAQVNNDTVKVVCLRLLRLAVDEGGPFLTHCLPIVALVHDDLTRALLLMTQGGLAPEVLSEALGVVTSLWQNFRTVMKIQFEALFNGTFLRVLTQVEAYMRDVAMGRMPPHRLEYSATEQEVILEALADLLAQDGVLEDLLVNYDCDSSRADVLLPLVQHLSNVAVLAASVQADGCLHLLCVRALASAVKAMGRHGQGSAGESDEPEKATGDPRPWKIHESEAWDYWTLRVEKAKLSRGAALFNEKPRKGFQYLEAEHLLPTPLTPEAAAKFLRSAPGLDKASVGEYLGKMGIVEADGETRREAYIGDTVAFHAKVLKAFVHSFDFRGQSILESLRMFLAAFRLPSEAQEIDRVLEAFAQEAYEHCVESQNGYFATSDVAYLLSFSIIMLNTDLHNPNIRPERRMTLADFKRSNTNYGAEISGGKDLPSDLLEEIYSAIKDYQIITKADGPSGVMTDDRWRDLVRQCAANPDLCVMTVRMEAPGAGEGTDGVVASRTAMTRHILELIWCPSFTAAAAQLSASSSVLAAVVEDGEGDMALGAPSRSNADGSGDWKAASKPALLKVSVDLTRGLAALAADAGHSHVLDSIVTALVGLTGLVGKEAPSAHREEVDGAAPENSQAAQVRALAPVARFLQNSDSQGACAALFDILHSHGDQMRYSWRPALRLVFALRDLRVLPRALLRESDPDLLSSEAREAFNGHLLAAEARRRDAERESQRTPRAPGLIAGIADIFFGPALDERGSGFYSYDYLWDELNYADERGDDGVGTEGASVAAKIMRNRSLGELNDACPALALDFASPPSLREACRRVLVDCGICDIIPNTRYLAPESLEHLVKSLIHSIQAAQPRSDVDGAEGSSAGPEQPALHFPWDEGSDAQDPEAAALVESSLRSFHALCRLAEVTVLPPLSFPSQALAEVLLVEVALRNRDRIAQVWSHVAAHYQVRTHVVRDVRLAVEKAFAGLLRLVCRLLSRESMTGELIVCLSWVVPPHADRAVFAVLADHVGNALWRAITGNVDALQTLSPAQWKTIFDAIRCCSTPGREGTRRAFAALCFVMHEPMLRVHVPASVLGAILTFMESPEERVALGAAELACVYMSLARDAATDADKQEAWTSAWLPSARAVAQGMQQRHTSVQRQSVGALADALLCASGSDVPCAVVHQLLEEALLPLAEELVATPGASDPTEPVVADHGFELVEADGKGNEGSAKVMEANRFHLPEELLRLLSRIVRHHLVGLGTIKGFDATVRAISVVLDVASAADDPVFATAAQHIARDTLSMLGEVKVLHGKADGARAATAGPSEGDTGVNGTSCE